MTAYLVDTNTLLYALDEKSTLHNEAKAVLQNIEKEDNYQLVTSSFVIEEIVHFLHKVAKLPPQQKGAIIDRVFDTVSNVYDVKATRKFTHDVLQLIEIHSLDSVDAFTLSSAIEMKVAGLVTFDRRLALVAQESGVQVFPTVK